MHKYKDMHSRIQKECLQINKTKNVLKWTIDIIGDIMNESVYMYIP